MKFRLAHLIIVPACVLGLFTCSSCGGGGVGQAVEGNASAGDLSVGGAPEVGTSLSTSMTCGQGATQPVKPLGINLGSSTLWGTEQLFANVLPNPGFEPFLDTALIKLNIIDGRNAGFAESWIGRADHEWAGAQAVVMTGARVGEAFRVLDNGVDSQGRQQLVFDRSVPTDLLGEMLRVKTDQLNVSAGYPLQPARWKTEGGAVIRQHETDVGMGKSHLRLNPLGGSSSVSAFMDSISDRAGNALSPDTSWVVSFRARTQGSASLRVQVSRVGQPSFDLLNVTLKTLPNEWTMVSLPLESVASGASGSLMFRLEAAGATVVDVDEVYLGHADQEPAYRAHDAGSGNFRPEVRRALGLLKAGTLRDWQGQLGDTPENRFASRAVRQPQKYRREGTELFDAYSVPELIALSAAQGASPWLILPTTWTPNDITEFVRLVVPVLRQHNIQHWLLEFGNENWNSVFQPAGFLNLNQHIQAEQSARKAFELAFTDIAQPSDPRPVWLANMQFANPPFRAETINGFSAGAQLSAGSYSVHTLKASDALPDALFDTRHEQYWSRWRELLRQANRKLIVPEVNLHPVGGDLPANTVNRWLDDPVAGAALVDNLLTGWAYGADLQVLYNLASFDTFNQQGQFVSLFGVFKDLNGTFAPRPSATAMTWLNDWLGSSPSGIEVLGNSDGLLIVIAQSVAAGVCQSQGVGLINRTNQPKEVSLPAPWAGLKAQLRFRQLSVGKVVDKAEGQLSNTITLPPFSSTLIFQESQ